MLRPRVFVIASIALVLACAVSAPPAQAKPEGTLTVAVATFGNERWLPPWRRWKRPRPRGL